MSWKTASGETKVRQENNITTCLTERGPEIVRVYDLRKDPICIHVFIVLCCISDLKRIYCSGDLGIDGGIILK